MFVVAGLYVLWYDVIMKIIFFDIILSMCDICGNIATQHAHMYPICYWRQTHPNSSDHTHCPYSLSSSIDYLSILSAILLSIAL